MIHFEKIRDIKHASERLVENHELVIALFESLPDLQHFKFVKTKEYDDNNYFDDISLVEINGHHFGYEGYDEEDEETSTLPKVEETHLVKSVVSYISKDYDFSDREIVILRENFKAENFKERNSAEKKYLKSYLSGLTLPKSFFLKNDVKWAVYYALDHGRFDEEAEFRIFSRKGYMIYALEYARHVIKGRLPSSLENFFILDPDEHDSKALKKYVSEFGGRNEEARLAAV